MKGNFLAHDLLRFSSGRLPGEAVLPATQMLPVSTMIPGATANCSKAPRPALRWAIEAEPAFKRETGRTLPPFGEHVRRSDRSDAGSEVCAETRRIVQVIHAPGGRA